MKHAPFRNKGHVLQRIEVIRQQDTLLIIVGMSAAVSAFIAFYNFCWRTRHNGKSGKLRPTAAMMAGLTDRLWSFTDLFDAVQTAEKERKSNERYARLADRLRNP